MIDKYDEIFKKYSNRFFGPAFDWRWFKSQTEAESNFDPTVSSSVGAMGLMQLMPETMDEVAVQLGVKDDPWDPEINIQCGIFYDRHCWGIWKKESDVERLKFMFASYNAGIGNILKAQRLAANPALWQSVAAKLPNITGAANAKQTIDYVIKIGEYYAELSAKDEK